MDATVRTMMRIRGQAAFNANPKVRQQQALKDEDALRRIMTMRGRTGAVFLLGMTHAEVAEDIATLMQTKCSEQVLSQIRFVATDQFIA